MYCTMVKIDLGVQSYLIALTPSLVCHNCIHFETCQIVLRGYFLPRIRSMIYDNFSTLFLTSPFY